MGMNVQMSLMSLYQQTSDKVTNETKLIWKINDVSKPPALLSSFRDGVVFVIYYHQPSETKGAEWTMKIIDSGETMKIVGPRLEPRSLMSEAEAYKAWKREL